MTNVIYFTLFSNLISHWFTVFCKWLEIQFGQHSVCALSISSSHFNCIVDLHSPISSGFAERSHYLSGSHFHQAGSTVNQNSNLSLCLEMGLNQLFHWYSMIFILFILSILPLFWFDLRIPWCDGIVRIGQRCLLILVSATSKILVWRFPVILDFYHVSQYCLFCLKSWSPWANFLSFCDDFDLTYVFFFLHLFCQNRWLLPDFHPRRAHLQETPEPDIDRGQICNFWHIGCQNQQNLRHLNFWFSSFCVF